MADSLSTVFAALADPTRRAILARLTAGDASVSELAAPFAMSLPAVSKHLNVLERAGLIARGRQAQWRPCHLEAEPLRQATGWLEEYRPYWEGRFDRLDDYLRDVQARPDEPDRSAQTVRSASDPADPEVQPDSPREDHPDGDDTDGRGGNPASRP